MDFDFNKISNISLETELLDDKKTVDSNKCVLDDENGIYDYLSF